MNKKQRNRKIVAQNNRNRIVNRRYKSTMRTLSKLFLSKVKQIELTAEIDRHQLKSDLKPIMNKFYSIVDKSVKKGVVHKNTAARKKSKFGLLLNKI